eukprot:Gb_38704 [translate_table: standard]
MYPTSIHLHRLSDPTHRRINQPTPPTLLIGASPSLKPGLHIISPTRGTIPPEGATHCSHQWSHIFKCGTLSLSSLRLFHIDLQRLARASMSFCSNDCVGERSLVL